MRQIESLREKPLHGSVGALLSKGAVRYALGVLLALFGCKGTSPSGDAEGYVTVGDGPRISAVDIEPNPDSVLSCLVRWRTDRPSPSLVMFRDGERIFEVSDDTPKTEHALTVIGMHAATSYDVRVVSRGPTGETAYVDTAFTSGPLPDIVPVLISGGEGATPTKEAWTLVNISDFSTDPPPPAVVAMYDDLGRPVWYHVHGDTPDDRGDVDVRLLDRETVLIGPTRNEPAREIDLAGNVLWEGPKQRQFEELHHHFDATPDGDFVSIKSKYVGEVKGDVVTRFTREHDVVWQWDLFDHMTPEPGFRGDWTHSNSVTLDDDLGVFFLSVRDFHQILKIDIAGESDILWRFGEGGDFEPDPDADRPWFIKQHDPQISSDGRILVYDNGDKDRPFSRVVEYAVDEEDLTSRITFEFPGAFAVDSWYRDRWYTPIWGDADRLGNGNILVTAGNRKAGIEASRVFEVTGDGEVVRELRFPKRDDTPLGVYRAQRISVPPLIAFVDADAFDRIGEVSEPDTEAADTPDAGDGAPVDGGVAEVPEFPLEWSFDDGPDGFESETFIHDETAGVWSLDYTFVGDDPFVVMYRTFFAADWTGADTIAVRLKSDTFSTGGTTVGLFSGYAWSWCSLFTEHPDTTEWTTVTVDLQEVCGEQLTLDMVQQLAVLATPGDDAVYPEPVSLRVDRITVIGSAE